MPKLWGGGVPTSDRGKFSPRLWVPSPYSLSPTRQSKPAFQWHGTNERIHRQWQQGTERTKGRHGGSNSQWMGRSCLPCDRRDRVLFWTSRRNHYPTAWEFATARGPKHLIFPLESSQAFETAVLNRWPWACEIPKYFARTTIPRWDTIKVVIHWYYIERAAITNPPDKNWAWW